MHEPEKPGSGPSPPQQEPARSGPSQNGNGLLVRKPLLSIKDSLKGQDPGKSKADEQAPPDEAEEDRATTTDEGDVGPVVESAKVLEAWREYTASVGKTKPRVFSTLNNNPPVEEDGVYRITLNSEAQLENFRKNIRPELLAHIRKTTGIGNLEIDARLAESDNREKKVYTDSDKLEFLVRKNPDLADFSARFGLDFDR